MLIRPLQIALSVVVGAAPPAVSHADTPAAASAAVSGMQGNGTPPAGNGTTTPAETSEGPVLSADQARDLTYDSANLRSAQLERMNRVVAAQRLLSMAHPAAYQALSEALRSGETGTIEAVLVAMSSLDRPPRELLGAAVDALRNAPADIVDRLAFAIMRYGEQAIGRIIALATDRQLPVPQRLGAVRTLPAVPSRETAAALMEIANPSRAEPEELRRAAFASLRRLSPVDHGTDFAAWTAWWQDARPKSREEWSAELHLRGLERVSALEREIDDLGRRYVAILRERYLELPLERQLERIPRDLDDTLPQARLFALDRIGVLLRDSVQIPETLRSKVIECLNDSLRPEVRRRAATLLAELDHPDLPTLLADRLSGEPNPQVAIAWLDVLSTRPHAAALDPILLWLLREPTAAAAARTLWHLRLRLGIPETDLEAVQQAARDAWSAFPSPPTARLAAILLPDDEASALDQVLRGENADLARAVAEGFAERGRIAPLLDLAAADAIYPFALRAATLQPPTVDAVRILLQLAPKESQLPRWEDAVRSLVRRLDPALLIEVDDLLAAAPVASLALRDSILAGVILANGDGQSLQTRLRLLQRLVPILIEQGLSLRAYEIVRTVGGTETDVIVAALRFETALLAGRFDEAAAINEDPARWLTVLSDAVARDPQAAARLRTEVLRRFASQMNAETSARLRSIDERLAARVGPSEETATPRQ